MGELTTPSCQQSDSKTIDNDPYFDTDYLSADSVYLDTISNTNVTQWNVILLIGCNPVLFKMDTRTEVTTLSGEAYRNFSIQ